jgi:eukaryotic-like serine/threonine-protein kinase
MCSEAESEKYQAAQRLLTLALDLPAEQREAFVAVQCGGRTELRDEVLALIAADAEASEFLEIPAPALVSPPVARVGPYRLLRTLGEGGTSVVHLAQREDGRVRPRVALKLVRPGMESAELLARFRQEQHILAALNHPNIARLLDAGESEDGRPYFVLEHVEGEPIDAYCERRHLSLRERLMLMATVCRAVHYAHQNLVVHRDLKPDNIVVTPAGAPKLLDFGIAKLLNPEIFPAGIAATTVDVRPMTPRFASPEQVRGKHITTATDVYSLGVLLYVLLTGRYPYEFSSLSVRDIELVICEQEPLPPSAAVSRQQRRSRGLSRELDMVVRVAMHKDPAHRYPSALELGLDLERYAAGFPVAARGDSFVYRLGKMIRRHVAVSFAAVLALTSLVVAAAGMTWQAHRATVAQARANHDRERLQYEASFLVDLVRIAGPNDPETVRAATHYILERGVKRARTEANLPADVRAALLQTLGVAYFNIGGYREAVPLLGEALELRRGLGADAAAEVVETLIALGNARWEIGDLREAEPLYVEALRLSESALGPEHPGVADSLMALARPAMDRNDFSVGDMYRRALAIRTRHYGEADPRTAEAEHGLAMSLYLRGRYDDAGKLALHVLSTRERAFGLDHPAVAESLNDLGIILLADGRFDEAERSLQRAYNIVSPTLGEEHPDVVDLRNSMAVVWREQGRLQQAESWHRETLAKRRALRGEFHSAVDHGLHCLARVLLLEGRYDEARLLAEQALAMRRAAYGPSHCAVAESLLLLGRMQVVAGEPASGETLLREALSIWKSVSPGHPREATYITELAQALAGQGRLQDAESLLLGALTDARARMRPRHPVIADVLIGLGMVRASTNARSAVPYLREALDIRLAALGPSHWLTAQAQSVLGAALVRSGDPELGQPLAEDGLASLRETLGNQHPETIAAKKRLTSGPVSGANSLSLVSKTAPP